jgi:transketolase
VVSMPCLELFEEQPAAYKDEVLPKGVRVRVAIEAGSPMGWHKYVGDSGIVIGLDRFGASAPGEDALNKLGFNVDNIVTRAKALVNGKQS